MILLHIFKYFTTENNSDSQFAGLRYFFSMLKLKLISPWKFFLRSANMLTMINSYNKKTQNDNRNRKHCIKKKKKYAFAWKKMCGLLPARHGISRNLLVLRWIVVEGDIEAKFYCYDALSYICCIWNLKKLQCLFVRSGACSVSEFLFNLSDKRDGLFPFWV